MTNATLGELPDAGVPRVGAAPGRGAGGRLGAALLLAALALPSVGARHDLSRVRIEAGSAKVVRAAADDLAYHLKLICGSRTDPSARFAFVFRAPADAAPLKPFESRYRIDGETVWFWGDDRSSGGPQRHGSEFAVSLFLEREMGVRWVWPGEEGIDFVPRTSVELPDRREGSFVTPPLLKSEIRNPGAPDTNAAYVRTCIAFTPHDLVGDPVAYGKTSHDEREIWLRRCRIQDRIRLGYGHAFTKWKDRFEKTHPEYLNWNAKRKERGYVGTDGRDRTKLCVSNEAVVDQIIADWLARGTNAYLNVCENDSGNYCECDGCRALDASLPGEKFGAHMTDRYCNLWNRIAAKARRIRPDVKLITYAYSCYRKAPRRERIAYPDNILFGFVPSLMDDAIAELAKWRARGMRSFFLRPNYHHYSGTIPRGLERVLHDVFRQCYADGMVACDFDTPHRRALNDFEFYVTVRMLEDPARPFETIAEEFYSAYGAAAGDVRRYYERVRRDGEAARDRYLALGTKQLRLLDDSELSIMQCFGREEKDLVEARAILAKAVADWRGRLPEKHMRRLVSLEKRAEDAVLTFRFLTLQRDPSKLDEMSRRGDELIAERRANRDWILQDWPMVFGNWYGERRTWWRIPKYLIEVVDGGTCDPRGERFGWSASFEARTYTKWRKDDAFSSFTDRTASRGRWSLRLDAARNSATENDNVRVTPGARYRMTADLRAEGSVVGGRLRILRYAVPEKKIPARVLAEPVFTDIPTDSWKTHALEFVAPTDFPEERLKSYGRDYLECVRATVRAQGGSPGSALLVDNIRFERLD